MKFAIAPRRPLNATRCLALTAVLACQAVAGPAMAQDAFVVTSPAFETGADLPADLKCTRDGGDGLSPPIEWSAVPDGTESLAVIMQHYPNGTVEGRDAPSQYWLLWNIPADTTALPRGNPASLGDEGADKDERGTGYTPPCSPPGGKHEYSIHVYALNGVPDALPTEDSGDVDWAVMSDAIEGLVIDSASISFWN